MRLLRKFIITGIILNLLFLGVFTTLLIIALLFRDESGGIKTFWFLTLTILFVIAGIIFNVYWLKREEAFHRESTHKRIVFERKAFDEWKRINRQREDGSGQIDTRLNKTITSGLIWLRILRSKKFIGLLFYVITPFMFWFIFNFPWQSSIALGLIFAFLIEGSIRIIVRYRIAMLFDKEFPPDSPDRAAAIEHLYQNRHAYWFAPELLKVVGR